MSQVVNDLAVKGAHPDAQFNYIIFPFLKT